MRGRIADINFDKALEFLKAGDIASSLRHAERANEFGHPKAPALLHMAKHLQRLQTLFTQAESGDSEGKCLVITKGGGRSLPFFCSDRGNEASYELGMLHICGVGMEERKFEEGMEFMQKAWDVSRNARAGEVITAADDGLAEAEKIYAVLRVLADHGHPEAQLEVAHTLITGGDGLVEQSEPNVVEGLRVRVLSFSFCDVSDDSKCVCST